MISFSELPKITLFSDFHQSSRTGCKSAMSKFAKASAIRLNLSKFKAESNAGFSHVLLKEKRF